MPPLPCTLHSLSRIVFHEKWSILAHFSSLGYFYIFHGFSRRSIFSGHIYIYIYIPVANTVLFHDEKKKISAATCRPTQLCPLLIPLHVSASGNKKIEKSLHLRLRNSIYTCNSSVRVSAIKNASLFPERLDTIDSWKWSVKKCNVVRESNQENILLASFLFQFK